LSLTHLLNNRARKNPTKFFKISCVTARAKDLKPAQAAACAAVPKIHFDVAHFRRDIAAKALRCY